MPQPFCHNYLILVLWSTEIARRHRFNITKSFPILETWKMAWNVFWAICVIFEKLRVVSKFKKLGWKRISGKCCLAEARIPTKSFAPFLFLLLLLVRSPSLLSISSPSRPSVVYSSAPLIQAPFFLATDCSFSTLSLSVLIRSSTISITSKLSSLTAGHPFPSISNPHFSLDIHIYVCVCVFLALLLYVKLNSWVIDIYIYN